MVERHKNSELEAAEEIPHLNTSKGADGKNYPRKPVSVFNPTKREERAMKKPLFSAQTKKEY